MSVYTHNTQSSTLSLNASASLTSPYAYTPLNEKNPLETIQAVAQKRIQTLGYIRSFWERRGGNWLNTYHIISSELDDATSQVPPGRTLGYFVLGMACGCVLDFPYQSQGSTGQGAKEMARAWMGVVREWETLTGGLNEESSTPGGEQDTKAKMKSFFRKGSTASLTSPTTTMAAEAGKAGEGKGGVGGVQVPAFGAEHGVVVVALLDVLVEMYTAFLSLVPSDPSTSSTQQGRPPSSAGISRESSFASASSSSASTLTAGAASAMTRAEQTLLLDMFVKIDGKIKRGVVGREVKELEGIARRGLGREIRGALAGLGGCDARIRGLRDARCDFS